MGVEYKVDMSGALHKSMILRNIPKATKFNATKWAADTTRKLKVAAANMKKSGQGRKTGQLARNVGFSVSTDSAHWQIILGTGVGNTTSVRYARIQDEGGTTHPNVTAKMRRYAWAMHYKHGGGKGAMNEKAAMFKRLALTKQSKLTVKIPASQWFTFTVSKQMPMLQNDMSESAIYYRASQMVA